jgi:hypothetical protein
MTDLLIPSPIFANAAIIRGSKLALSDRLPEDLLTSWRDHPSAAALGESMQELMAMQRRAAAHRPFAAPTPAERPYEVTAANRTAGEFNRGVEEREAARAASEPKQSWVARSWSMTFGPNAPMPSAPR